MSNEEFHVVERIIERNGSNGGFNKLKDVVFLAIILGAGAIIWQQQATIADIKQHLAVLDLKCDKQPVFRGGAANERP
jgi:hypothetical protein